MICFDLGANKELYLFIINRDAVPDPPQNNQPDFRQISKLATRSWTSGDNAYLLAVQGNRYAFP